MFTVVAYAAGVGLGLWVHRFVGRSNARQEQMSAELAVSQEELAVAYQRQGAAEERERLAREIHDTPAQGFASIVVLADAVGSAARGETVLAPKVAERLVARLRRPEPVALTAREREVLHAVADGLSNAEIGRRLVIGEATVKTHLLRVFAKLDVSDRTRAVVVALERGLLVRS